MSEAQVFRPQFTTSQSTQEDKKEERPEGGWATSKEGTTAPTNSRAVGRPVSRPVVKEVVPPPLTDRQKRMLKP